MGDDYRYSDPCRDGDRYHDHDKYRDPCDKFDHCDPCDHKDDDWDWSDWLPILIIVFILIGGLDWFNGSDKDCCGGGKDGSGSWLLILVVIFLIWQGQGDGKKGGFGLF